MNSLCPLSIVLIALFCAFPTKAEKLVIPEALRQAIEQSYLHHPSLRQAQLGAEMQELEIDVAKAGYLPQADILSNWNYNNHQGVQPNISNYNSRTGLSVRQNIYDSGRTKYGIETAKLGHEASEISVQSVQNGLSMNVLRVYLELIKQGISYNLALKHFYYVRSVYEFCLQNKCSAKTLASAKFQKERAKDRKHAILRKNEEAIALYVNQVGQPPAESFEIPQFPPIPKSADAAINKAYNYNYGILQKKKVLESKKAAVKQAKAQGRLSVSANAFTGYQDDFGSGQDIDGHDSSVGLTISIPLYTGGVVTARTEQAQLQQSQSDADLFNSQLLVSKALTVLYTRIADSKLRLPDLKTALVASKEGVCERQEQFTSSEGQDDGALLDLLEQRSAQLDLELNYLATIDQHLFSKYEIMASTAQFLKLVGSKETSDSTPDYDTLLEDNPCEMIMLERAVTQ